MGKNGKQTQLRMLMSAVFAHSMGGWGRRGVVVEGELLTENLLH